MSKKFVKKNSVWNDERGVYAYWYAFLIIAFIGIILFALISPVIANLATNLYTTAQPINEQTRLLAGSITDANTRVAIVQAVQVNQDAQAENIILFLMLATYGGIIVITVIAIVMTLIARKNVEVGTIQ